MRKLPLVTAAAIALNTISAFADMQSLTKDVRFCPSGRNLTLGTAA
jgi:hypothetical protein